MNVFILHSAQLPQRKESVNAIVSRLREDKDFAETITIIQSNDPAEIPVNIIQQIIDYSVVNDAHLAQFNQFTKNIHINQLSHILKHFDTLQKIAKEGADDKVYLILEDDAVFQDITIAYLTAVAKQMKEEQQGIVFLGLPSIKEYESITIHEVAETAMVPLIDSYFITKATAKRMLEAFLPIRFTGVIQMNYIIRKLGMKVFQSSKPVIINGSRYGLFPSTLNPNNTLIYNPDYMELVDIFKKGDKSAIPRVQQLQESSVTAKSPDFMHLIAKIYTAHGMYQEAQKVYMDAYNTALTNGSIVNHESSMLKDFIRLFKHLQQ